MNSSFRKILLGSMSLILLLVMQNCVRWSGHVLTQEITEVELAAAVQCGISAEALRDLNAKPMYRFSEIEIDRYLGYLQLVEPDLRRRIGHLATKFIGQPYQIYLLGEFPFELYDPQPLYSIGKSDCVVFSEHVYAMALAHDWTSFMKILQRIRYKDGNVGVLNRNHYTEYDWDRNNDWLVEDITGTLAGDETVLDTMIVDKARFFRKWNIGQDIPVDTLIWDYLPYRKLPLILDSLKTGDFVNIVRGQGKGRWVGHVGLIHVDASGMVNFLHSIPPKVKKQPIMELVLEAEKYNRERAAFNAKIGLKNEVIRRYNEKQERLGRTKRKAMLASKPYFYGFRFLRLREDPLAELRKTDG